MTGTHIYRTTSAHLALLLLLLVGKRAESREWQSLVNHDIVRKSNVDSRRYEFSIEADPFFYPGDKSPTEIPTEPPQVQKVWTTFSPTKSPSSSSTEGPTMTPTVLDAELNGGCRGGQKPYEVHMKDTWGDGWEGTSITITGLSDLDPLAADLPTNSMTTTNTNAQGDTVVSITKTIDFDINPVASNQNDSLGKIFEGTLTQGYHDFSSICLVPNRCYRLVANGGEFLEEVSWEIRPGRLDQDTPILEPILLSGSAPTECTFSLPDEYGHHFCENTCSESILADSIATPPEVTEHLQSHEEDKGSVSGSIPQVTPVTQSMISNTESSVSTSDVLKDFNAVSANEDGAAPEPLTEAVEQPQLLSGSLGEMKPQVTPITQSMISNTESSVSTSDVLKDFDAVSANEGGAVPEPLTEAVGKPQVLSSSLGGMKSHVTPITQSMISDTKSSVSASDLLKDFKFATANEGSTPDEPSTEAVEQPPVLSGSMGVTPQVTPVTQSMISNSGSNIGTSNVLKSFKFASAGEENNN